MIVPAMNSEELTKEVFKDLESVNIKAMYLAQGLRREAVKSKSKYVQRIFEYKSRRHNQWLIIIDYYVKHPFFTVVIYYNDDFGLNGIMVEASNQGLIHFTPHFIERYNERYLGMKNMPKLDLLKLFIPNNSMEVIKVIPGGDNKEQRIFGRFKEGIGLGFKEVFHGKEFFHFKTFITVDMIQNRQIGVFNMTGKMYDEFWNDLDNRNKRCA
jgi:hypothetical protein